MGPMPEQSIALDDDGRRLDRVLRAAFPDVPPGAIAAAIRKGRVRIDGKRCSHNSRVRHGERVSYPDWTTSNDPRGRPADGNSSTLAASVGPELEVLARTKDWLAINKPAGSQTAGPKGIDNEIRRLAAANGWWSPSMSFRPGPVHRLDFATSGVQLFSLSAEGARMLSEQFRRRRTFKAYLTLVSGSLESPTYLDQRLYYDKTLRKTLVEDESGQTAVGYRSAATRVYPLVSQNNTTLVAAIPESGRTHQIRAHLSAGGYPIIGDKKYGGAPWGAIGMQPYAPPGIDGEVFFLHASYLAVFAATKQRLDQVAVTAPLPATAIGLLRALGLSTSRAQTALHNCVVRACPECAATDTIEL